MRVCDAPPSFAKRELGSRPTREVRAGAHEAEGVEVERVEAAGDLPDLLDPLVPGGGGVGLVQAADVDDVLPEPCERFVGVELRVDDPRPGTRGVGGERPRDRAVVDHLEHLLDGRQLVAAGAAGVDAVEQAGRHERHEHDARRVEVAEVEHPPPEPRRHPLERAVRRGLVANPLHRGVDVDDVDVAGALLVRPARDRGHERLRLRERLDGQHLIRLDVRADRDDQVRVALEEVGVHPPHTLLWCGDTNPFNPVQRGRKGVG